MLYILKLFYYLRISTLCKFIYLENFVLLLLKLAAFSFYMLIYSKHKVLRTVTESLMILFCFYSDTESIICSDIVREKCGLYIHVRMHHHLSSSSSSQLYPYSGSPFLMSLLQELLSWAISSCSPFSVISSPTQSFHLILGLPLFRVLFTSISITSLATCCSFLLIRWPYILNLASWTFRDTSLTFTDPLTCSFFTLSIIICLCRVFIF